MTEKTLSPQDILYVQIFVRKIQFYSKAIDITMIVDLNTIGVDQANGTTCTMESVTWLLEYCATHQDEKLRHKASGMILKIHSDASYLSVSKV